MPPGMMMKEGWSDVNVVSWTCDSEAELRRGGPWVLNNTAASIFSLTIKGNLTELPATLLGNLTNLDVLILKCPVLKTLDAGLCQKLSQLYVVECSKLESLDFPKQLYWLSATGTNLTSVKVTGCKELNFLDVEGNPNLGSLIGLADCKALFALNVHGCNLKSLEGLAGCGALFNLKVSKCSNLKSLDIKQNLRRLNAKGCIKLESLNLTTCMALDDLDVSDCTALKKLDVSGCSELRTLKASGCAELEQLKLTGCMSLVRTNLDLAGCVKLRKQDFNTMALERQQLLSQPDGTPGASSSMDQGGSSDADMGTRSRQKRSGEPWKCDNIKEFEKQCSEDGAGSIVKLTIQVCPPCPCSLQVMHLNRERMTHTILAGLQGNLTELPAASWESLTNLKELQLECPNLKTLDLTGCRALIYLKVNGSHNLESVIGLAGCKALKHLEVYRCTKLKSLEGLLGSKVLEVLETSGCSKLESLDVTGCMALGILSIIGCTALESLHVAATVKMRSLKVRRCSKLASLDLSDSEQLHDFDAFRCTALASLDISGCSELEFLDLTGLGALDDLNVSGCRALRSLTASKCTELETLDVSGCSTLGELNIEHCKNLIMTEAQLEGCPLHKVSSRGCVWDNLPPTLQQRDLEHRTAQLIIPLQNLEQVMSSIAWIGIMLATASFVGFTAPPGGFHDTTGLVLIDQSSCDNPTGTSSAQSACSAVNNVALHSYFICDLLTFFLALATTVHAVTHNMPHSGKTRSGENIFAILFISSVLLMLTAAAGVCTFMSGVFAVYPRERYKDMYIAAIPAGFVLVMAVVQYIRRIETFRSSLDIRWTGVLSCFVPWFALPWYKWLVPKQLEPLSSIFY